LSSWRSTREKFSSFPTLFISLFFPLYCHRRRSVSPLCGVRLSSRSTLLPPFPGPLVFFALPPPPGPEPRAFFPRDFRRDPLSSSFRRFFHAPPSFSLALAPVIVSSPSPCQVCPLPYHRPPQSAPFLFLRVDPLPFCFFLFREEVISFYFSASETKRFLLFPPPPPSLLPTFSNRASSSLNGVPSSPKVLVARRSLFFFPKDLRQALLIFFFLGYSLF